MPGNKIKLKNINSEDLEVPLNIIRELGAKLDISGDAITIESTNEIKAFNIKTESFPGFPTDLQAQFMVAAALANGESKIKEEIFPSRFIHVAELRKLGANIKLENNTAIVNGVAGLNGARMQASDLRASACLIIAGVAKNKSEIGRVYHLDRGYEKIDNKLEGLGVKICRKRITLALAKGRIFNDTLTLLEKVEFLLKNRQKAELIFKLDELTILSCKPSDVPKYVELGAADCGIVGSDCS